MHKARSFGAWRLGTPLLTGVSAMSNSVAVRDCTMNSEVVGSIPGAVTFRVVFFVEGIPGLGSQPGPLGMCLSQMGWNTAESDSLTWSEF